MEERGVATVDTGDPPPDIFSSLSCTYCSCQQEHSPQKRIADTHMQSQFAHPQEATGSKFGLLTATTRRNDISHRSLVPRKV